MKDLFLNPKNVGEIKSPDGFGEAKDNSFGDIIYMYLIIKEDIIDEIKFESLGCRVAMASSSKLTEMVKKKTIHQALSLTEKDIKKKMGYIPPNKEKCLTLAIKSLKKAIINFQEKSSS